MSAAKLQAAMLTYPQVEVETHHQFADGIYVRSMVCLAGTLIVGKVHKRDHFIMVLQGRVSVSDENGSRELQAPEILKCSAGTRRSLYFHTDSVWTNVHRTDETDLAKIEDELVIEDLTSPFLPGNKLPLLESL